MLLAEELALVALDPRSGRHAVGHREQLNACLAGLLVAELALGADPTGSPVLAAAAEVVSEHGPKTKSVLSAMGRGLNRRLGLGTWDAVVGGLVSAGVVAPPEGGLRARHEVLDTTARDSVVERLQVAARTDDPMDARTAVLLSMTGPAQLLEVIAPERQERKHARRRIDRALDSSSLADVGDSVRKVLAEAAAAVAAGAAVAVVASGT